jgi:hypothetical protein
VDPQNTPAVYAYRRLGYREVCRLIEAPVTRRDLFGFGAALQRALARWRGRGLDGEIVSGTDIDGKDHQWQPPS